ncbi:MAG: hypothetical protein WCX91_05995, partial [Candidatus Omnitrophota bacterium]
MLTDQPEFSRIRNIVYFGEADDGYVVRALNGFIKEKPEIFPRVSITASGMSVKLSLPEIKEFLSSDLTLELAREEEKNCYKQFFARDFKNRRDYMEKTINRKLEKLSGERFDVIIAVSNASVEQLREIRGIVNNDKRNGYKVPADLESEENIALKNRIISMLDIPKTARELIHELGVRGLDNMALVYRICKNSEEIETIFSGKRYLRMDRVYGEVIPRLSPSMLRSFVDYEIIGRRGDPEIQERLKSLEAERLKISHEKENLARYSAEKALNSCGLKQGVVFLIAGDVSYGMSHNREREERSTGTLVKGSDLDILAIVDESLFEKSPDADIDNRLYDAKWFLLKNSREELDYIIKPLTRIYEYRDNVDPKDTIAVKIIAESKFLCGDEQLYAKVKAAIRESPWQEILDANFQTARQRRKSLVGEIIESPVADWSNENRKEFVGEEGEAFFEFGLFILAKNVAKFSTHIDDHNVARIFKRYAEGLKFLEEYLEDSGKITGPPGEIPVAYYDKISRRIVFNISESEVLKVIQDKGFDSAEALSLWFFICEHEKYHQKYPHYSEEEVLEAQYRDLEDEKGVSGSDGFIFKRWDKDPQCLAKGPFGRLEEMRDYPRPSFFAEADLPADYTCKINSSLMSVKKKIIAEGIFKEGDFDIMVSVMYPAYKSATFRRAKCDKYEIFLDRRCFANSDFLYLAVKHELTDIKIQKLVSDIDPALRELFTLVYVNVDGAMKLRNEHPIKAGDLLKYLRKVANPRIGLFARYEKIFTNPALNDPSDFIRDICRMLVDETVYFKNMRRRAEVLLEGQAFRFNILRARLDILNKKLVESGHLTGSGELEPLSAFLGGMPQALKAFARYAGNVQYMMEGGNVFLKVNFRDEKGEGKFAYLYLGRNDN